jgi:hypothetical protein
MKIKRLVPAGKKPSGKTVTSLKLARKLTTVFHGLLTAREAAVAGAGGSSRSAEVARIDAEIVAFGGREAYQEASALSTRTFRSSRWIFKTLTRFGTAPSKGELPLRVLEIGAVNAQLAVCPWLRVRAIDIRSSDPAVEQKDFFNVPVGSGPTGTLADVLPAKAAAKSGGGAGGGRDRVWGATPCRLRAPKWLGADSQPPAADAAAPAIRAGQKRSRNAASAGGGDGGVTPYFYDESAYSDVRVLDGVGPVRLHAVRSGGMPVTGAYDVVVCAMVLNCVFEPVARARMLVQARDHLAPGGLLYFAVPSRCLDKSEFLTRSVLEGLFKTLGFAQRAEKRTPKISFYLLERIDILPADRFRGAAVPQARDITAAPSAGHGASWAPRISPADEKERALLSTRLADPPKTLPAALLPVTGFSRTTFSIAVPPAWFAGRGVPGK